MLILKNEMSPCSDYRVPSPYLPVKSRSNPKPPDAREKPPGHSKFQSRLHDPWWEMPRELADIDTRLSYYRCGHSLVLGLFERVELLFLAAQLRRLGKDSASYKRPSLMYLP